MTVAGPVLLVILGVSLYIYSTVAGKTIKFRTLATIVPYLWMFGVALLSHGMMAGGLMGEPRRTNMGMTYTNPDSDLFNKHWVATSTTTMIGGFVMGAAALLYFISFFATATGKKTVEPGIELPESEELHAEKPIPLLLNMRPWIIVGAILILFTYIPALISVFKYSAPVRNKFQVENPINMIK